MAHLSLAGRAEGGEGQKEQTTSRVDPRIVYLLLFLAHFVYLFGPAILLRLLCAAPVVLLAGAAGYLVSRAAGEWRPVATMRISASDLSCAIALADAAARREPIRICIPDERFCIAPA